MAPFVPVPDILTQPYWDGCKQHVITVQQCKSCGRKRHRPAAGCHWCGGREVDWVELSGRGTLYTYTVVHRAFHPSLANEVPYVVGLVAAEEDPTVRFHTRILECDAADVQVGMKLDVLFQEEEGGIVLPYWRPETA